MTRRQKREARRQRKEAEERAAEAGARRLGELYEMQPDLDDLSAIQDEFKACRSELKQFADRGQADDAMAALRELEGIFQRYRTRLGKSKQATWEALQGDLKRMTEALELASGLVPKDPDQERRERVPIPEAVRHEVWRRDQGRCVQCGSQANLEFDHIIPLSQGGSNTERNLQLLCEG